MKTISCSAVIFSALLLGACGVRKEQLIAQPLCDGKERTISFATNDTADAWAEKYQKNAHILEIQHSVEYPSVKYICSPH